MPGITKADKCSVLKENLIAFQHIKICFAAGEEDHLMAGSARLEQFTGLFHAFCVHIGEGIIKDDDTAAFRKEMVQHRKAECKGYCFPGSLGQFSVVQQIAAAVNIQVQLCHVRKF